MAAFFAHILYGKSCILEGDRARVRRNGQVIRVVEHVETDENAHQQDRR